MTKEPRCSQKWFDNAIKQPTGCLPEYSRGRSHGQESKMATQLRKAWECHTPQFQEGEERIVPKNPSEPLLSEMTTGRLCWMHWDLPSNKCFWTGETPTRTNLCWTILLLLKLLVGLNVTFGLIIISQQTSTENLKACVKAGFVMGKVEVSEMRTLTCVF